MELYLYVFFCIDLKFYKRFTRNYNSYFGYFLNIFVSNNEYNNKWSEINFPRFYHSWFEYFSFIYEILYKLISNEDIENSKCYALNSIFFWGVFIILKLFHNFDTFSIFGKNFYWDFLYSYWIKLDDILIGWN